MDPHGGTGGPPLEADEPATARLGLRSRLLTLAFALSMVAGVAAFGSPTGDGGRGRTAADLDGRASDERGRLYSAPLPPGADPGEPGDDTPPPEADSIVVGASSSGAPTSVTSPSTTSTSAAPTTTTEPRPSTTDDPQPWPDGVTYYNDFSAELGPEWERYDGVGNAGWGLRRSSALSIIDDPGAEAGGRCLAITAAMGTGSEAGHLVSGGLKLIGYGRTYGRFTVRMRVDDDPDQVTSGVALLWPTSDNWPQDGEINIVENYYNRDTRSPVESRLHWMRPDAEPPYDRADDALNAVELPVDATRWHTYTVEWRADAVTVAVDGGVPQLLSGGDAVIPRWDMDLALQLDALDAPDTGTQPVLNGTVSMCVDFVRIEDL